MQVNKVLGGAEQVVFSFVKNPGRNLRGVVGRFGTNGEKVELSLFKDTNKNGVLDAGDRHIKTRHAVGGENRLFTSALTFKGRHFGVLKGERGDRVFFNGKLRNLFGAGRVRTQVEYRDRVQATSSTNTVEVIKEVQVPVETVRTEYIYLPSAISNNGGSTTPQPTTPAGTGSSNSLMSVSVVGYSEDSMYSNTVGFFRVETDGSVIDPLTGASVSANDGNYTAAALRRSQVTGDGFSFSESEGATQLVTANLRGGAEYRAFIVADGAIADGLSGGKHVFVEGTALGSSQVKRSGNGGIAGSYSFEDTLTGINGISDGDGNDSNFTLSVKTAVAA